MIGQTISHYRILERLGGGGMGVVYKAQDLQLQRTVALKFLPEDLTQDPAARERLLAEARAASTLDDPHLCTIHEIGAAPDGQLFIAMAYYPGETLRERIHRGPLPVAAAVDIALQVARGLQRAHEAGILHRDIKPANVMLTDRGEVKILDFGLAKLAAHAALTRTIASAGTPAYMAPEQIRNEAVGSPADLWSLGVVLYEMLTGALPFAGETHTAIIYSVLTRDPQPLLSKRSGLPATLERIVARALAKPPAERYATAGELADALADELTALGGPLPSQSAVEGAQRFRVDVTAQPVAAAGGRGRGRRFRAALVASVAVISLVAAIAALLARREHARSVPAEVNTLPAVPNAAGAPAAARSTALAVLPFTVRGSPHLAYLSDGMVDLLSTKLDGAGDLRCVDPRALLGSLARESPAHRDAEAAIDPQQAQAIAERFGSRYYLLGSVLEAGVRLQLDATVYACGPAPGRSSATTGRGESAAGAGEATVVSQASAEGRADQLFDVVDRLVADLLAGMQVGPGARVVRTATMTTASLTALKSYLEGEREFRSGQFGAAADAFQSAVQADSMFALAWYRLSLALEWTTAEDMARTAAERAFTMSGRLSEHDRSLLEAFLAHRQGRAEEAERRYRAILATHPDEIEAWFQLGEVLFHYGPEFGRPAEASREAWERLLQLEPDHMIAQWHLARLEAAAGHAPQCVKIIDGLLGANPDTERAAELKLLRAFQTSDRASPPELDSIVRGINLATGILAIMDVSMFAKDIPGAVRVAQLCAATEHSDENLETYHRLLAHLELARGRWAAAQLEIGQALRAGESAVETQALLLLAPLTPATPADLRAAYEALRAWDADAVAPSPSASAWASAHNGMHGHLRLFLLGMLAARLVDAAAAERYAAELAQRPGTEQARALAPSWAATIRAQVALSAGQAPEALAVLEKNRAYVYYQRLIASPFFSQALRRYLKAQALAAAGRKDEAITVFGSFAEVSPNDLTWLAPSHLERARLCEQLGRRTDALSHYHAFVDLWHECDASLRSYVEEAQRAIDRLGTAQ